MTLRKDFGVQVRVFGLREVLECEHEECECELKQLKSFWRLHIDFESLFMSLNL